MILQAAADTGLIDVTNPASTTALLALPLSRAHGYLSDLDQRKPSLEDEATLILLGDQLSHVEALPSDKHLSIPIQRADYASGSSASSRPMVYTQVKRSATIW